MCRSRYLPLLGARFRPFPPSLAVTIQFTEPPEKNFVVPTTTDMKKIIPNFCARPQVEPRIRQSIISTFVPESTTSLKGMLQSILAAIDSNPASTASKRSSTR